MNYPPYIDRIAAVVLDWAGTAVDYGCMGPTAVFVDVFRTRQIDVAASEARRYMGLSKIEHLRALCASEAVSTPWRSLHGSGPSEADIRALYAEIERDMAASVAGHADLIPGLLDAISAFRSQGIRIGSCSGYPRKVMDALIDAAHQSGYRPDSVVCVSDVPAGRPYPWMCYHNAINLNVYPMAAMVKIGDTVSDIHEGIGAGMWTVGLTKTGNELGLTETEANALPAAELTSRLKAIEARFIAAGAHYTVESIADCPALIAEINGRLKKGERP